ncbi:MAG: PepSY domain-containing protein [Pseudomonadota bacterium]
MKAKALSVAAALLIGLSTIPAIADDDDLTKYEHAQLREALRDIGCHGGEFERESDGTYEVDDAVCKDGKEYEFKFTKSFDLIGGERD